MVDLPTLAKERNMPPMSKLPGSHYVKQVRPKNGDKSFHDVEFKNDGRLLRACLFGLSVAGCAGKAAV
jgi:hypothetical protein